MQLCHVEWSPDGRSILFGTLQCEVHIYDSAGNYLSQLPLYCLDDSASQTSIIGIDWYDGAEGTLARVELPRLRLTFVNTGTVLACEEEPGFFVSDRRDEQILELLRGVEGHSSDCRRGAVSQEPLE